MGGKTNVSVFLLNSTFLFKFLYLIKTQVPSRAFHNTSG